jgi:sucrose-6-phosphate hydrolase SacC (GH32 family)
MSSQPCSGKELRYATSTDLIRWTPVSTTLLADLGCGVPNVVRAGDEYRLYYVRGREVTSAAGHKSIEHGTFMATSPDGLTWTPTDRLISPQDFVDPSVVQLADGSWLMFTADFSSAQPPPPGFFQKLYVGTSDDGRTWDFDATAPLYVAGSNQGAFDPDAVVLPDGSVRAWWSQGTSYDNARITAGQVTVTPSPEPEPIPGIPGKPRLAPGKAGVKVTWTYPAAAPTPDGYLVQVKVGRGWTDVAQVTTRSTSLTWAKVGAKPGKAFSVRVGAYIGETMVRSPIAKGTRPRR